MFLLTCRSSIFCIQDIADSQFTLYMDNSTSFLCQFYNLYSSTKLTMTNVKYTLDAKKKMKFTHILIYSRHRFWVWLVWVTRDLRNIMGVWNIPLINDSFIYCWNYSMCFFTCETKFRPIKMITRRIIFLNPRHRR